MIEKHRNFTKYLKLHGRKFFALFANSCIQTILRPRLIFSSRTKDCFSASRAWNHFYALFHGKAWTKSSFRPCSLIYYTFIYEGPYHVRSHSSENPPPIRCQLSQMQKMEKIFGQIFLLLSSAWVYLYRYCIIAR